jgi:hypothetical protein
MKKPHRNKSYIWTWVSLLVLLLACNVTFSTIQPTPSIAPTAGSITATPVSLLSRQVTLVSVPFIESDPGSNYPSYTITAQTPQLTGSDDPRVLAFNQRLNDLVTEEVESYRRDFRSRAITPLSNGSYLEVTYTTVSQIGDLWSLKFDFSFYADTAAHPGLNHVTLNYDLGQGRELGLGDLFLPDSGYLEAISRYCIAELQKQPYSDSFIMDGAQPTLQNYRNWNVAPEGLIITFGAYQVAPGAAGPQRVIVPYGELRDFINPQGPLAISPP